MNRNPYKLDLPAVVSFSGGRTSGFLLYKVLEAYEFEQPDDLVVCFQNTGLEHDATYDFIERVAEAWSVDVKWLEMRLKFEEAGGPNLRKSFAEVTPQTASRNGEPFTTLIWYYGMLPNVVARFCTGKLKEEVLYNYLKTIPAFDDGWDHAVGLRADEPHRAMRARGHVEREDKVCPLYHAGVTEDDVLAFWKRQRSDNGLDLELPLTGNMSGNCVGCFLKSKFKMEILAREMPRYFEWWTRMERLAEDFDRNGPPRLVALERWREQKRSGALRAPRFHDNRISYTRLMDRIKEQPSLFTELDDTDTIPCTCTD